ncbi:MAG TPA: metallophosphoesterase [Pyrinomonadaceae bacterium]|nr:metallophosphoesterase [Pyrinomonadaceae bacterium]
MSYGYFIEPNRLVVRHEEIKIKRWDPAFDGIRIALIGDVHGGSNSVTAEKLRLIVEKTNAENPDLIILLGDYVSQTGYGAINDRPLKMPIEEVAENLNGLKAKYGVFAVIGNHDWWYGSDNVADSLSANGIRVLQNQLVEVVSENGKKLRILGLKDHMQQGAFNTFHDAVREAAGPTDGTGDLILLEHSPDILPVITGEYNGSDDLRLILSAHTHGGQIWLPIIGTPIVPSGFGQKYARGHIKDRGVDMYVTSGIGTSVLPFRFMVPPEIVILTIRSE